MRILTASFAAAIGLVGCDNQGSARGSARAEFEPRKPDPGAAEARPAKAAVLADRAGTRDEAPPEVLGDDRPDDAPLADEPAPPEPPPDYGFIHPSRPPPEASALTVHALAGFEVVAIHDAPDAESAKLGYLRIGTRVKVADKVEGPGCPRGWHALAQGGYACASKGLVVDRAREPFMQHAPPPPKVDEPLPYEYAYVKRWNTPMWWRVPTQDEVASAEALREVRERERIAAEAGVSGQAAKPEPSEPSVVSTRSDKPDKPDKRPQLRMPGEGADDVAKDDGAGELPSVDDDDPGDKAATKPAAKPAAQPSSASPPAAKQPAPEKELIPADRLPLRPEKSWLERGFFISVGDKLSEEGRTWWRTARGAYVEASATYKYGAKDSAGVPLPEGATFPFGFVMADTTKLLELGIDNKLKVVGTLEKRAFVDLSEAIEIAGKSYMMTDEGKLIRAADLRLADQQVLPDGLQPWERWIDVSLDKQILVAYEGTRPVFTALVSTGKKGTQEESFETPTGRWRIRSKHVTTTMDGNSASDGNYSIQDVPWTMYFDGNYALHGAFWHQGFGRVRSHGCVNLGPSAARWLFFWTTPFLPEGWHGVHAHAGSPGTTVIVRR